MVHAAHASRYHWGEVGGPEQLAIGEWQCARVYSVLGPGRAGAAPRPPVRRDRRRANDVPDWLVASGHEALARAYAVAGDREEARRQRGLAHAALAKVTDPEERRGGGVRPGGYPAVANPRAGQQ